MNGIQVEHKQKFGAQDLTTGTAFPGFGTSGTTACAGNDPRLSDARPPTGHAASHNAGGGDALAADAAAGTPSLRTLGTGATQAAPGNDSRIVGAVQTSRSVLTGTGLSGGGDLSADRTLVVAGLTGEHEANAVEANATPASNPGVGLVVVPFATLPTTGSVGFIAPRKCEIISISAHKTGTTGSTNDVLDAQVGGVSILAGGTPASLNSKAAGAFVAMSLDSTKQVVNQGDTVTLVGTAGTTDCACRGYVQLIPVA